MTKYDDLDYHAEAATKAGQPASSGYTHIALYLRWLVHNDLHNPDFISSALAGEIATGSATLQDLIDATDEKLLSDFMAAEGATFSDHAYDKYLGAFERVFSNLPDYAVPHDTRSYELIAPELDRLYQDWIAAGRPAATEHETDGGRDRAPA